MKKSLVVLVVAVLVVAGCFYFFKRGDKSVAIVNGESVLTSDYNTNLQNILNIYKQQNPQVLEQPYAKDYIGKRTLNDMIIREVLVQEGKKAGLTAKAEEIDAYIEKVKENLKDPKTGEAITDKAKQNEVLASLMKSQNVTDAKYRQNIENDIILEKFKRAFIAKFVKPVTEPELKTFFNNISVIYNNNKKEIEKLKKNPGQFEEANVLAERLKVNLAPKAQIELVLVYANKAMDEETFKARAALAKAIKAEIDSSKDFNAVANKYASDKDAQVFYSKMNVFKGMVPLKISSKAFDLSVNEVSDPIEIISENPAPNTAEGFFIIKTDAKVAGSKFTYDQYAKQLEIYVNNKRAENLFTQATINALNSSEIKIIKKYDVDKQQKKEENKKVDLPAAEAPAPASETK